MKFRIASTVVLTFIVGTTLMCSKQEQQTPAPKVKAMTTAPNCCVSEKQAPDKTKVLADIKEPRPEDNQLCMVCHASMADEQITKAHFDQGILCVDCHGRSTEHMEDEMLNTTPDIKYGRLQAQPFCKACHETHKHPVKVEEFLGKWMSKDRPNGRVITSNSICTDCHGIHVQKAAGQESSETAEEPGKWISLFNGKDLTGWKQIGTAKWSVENGAIVGIQGENNTGGDLLTEATFKDFMLTATYKVHWPANTGIWFRYQNPQKAYQVDILEHPKPVAYSGTIYCPGKLFIAVNLDKDLVDRQGWNTISVRNEGKHLQAWLNGHKVAHVYDDTTDSGSIGIQTHQGKHVEGMKVIVREIKIQLLGQQ